MLIPEVAVPGPGQCLLYNIDGRLFVERADTSILLASALIAQIRAGKGHSDLHLDGDVLTVDGSNQRITYRFEPPDGTGYRLARLI